MKKEQTAAELLNKNIKPLKRTLRYKIEIYALNFKPTLRKFIEKLNANDYEILRKIPDNCDSESYLTGLLKDFLIEEAYFDQDAHDYPRKIIDTLVDKKGIDPGLCLDIDSFVKEKIEEYRFARIKTFKEKSKFSTFLYMVVRSQAFEYLRVRERIKAVSKNFEKEIVKNLYGDTIGPDEIDDYREKEELKEKIAALLPQKVQNLEVKENIAFRLYYREHITNISQIARDLGTTRHKADQIIKRAWNKILVEIENEIGIVFSKSKKNSSNKDGGKKTKTLKRRSP